jgi:hypothetical protein
MGRQLLFTVVFCLLLTTVLSIRCYTGTDRQCLLAPDITDCGSGDTCQCAKYRFQCTEDDQACTKQEQLHKTTKWAYTIVASSTCQMILATPSVYEQAVCCSKNGCNRPASGRCSWSQARRRSLRKLTDLLEF